MPTLAPNQDDVFTVLRTFLLGVLPAGTKVFQSQINRVSEPSDANFVVMTPLRTPRLGTNFHENMDAIFTGSIAGATMTITAVHAGTLSVGQAMFGTGVADGTTIMALASGTGGVGTYTVSPSQNAASQILSGGSMSIMQSSMCVVQLDVHGPESANNAQVISTLFYDDYAVQKFAELTDAITPLNCDGPHQMPFINENQQYENRWVLDVSMEVNQAVSIPQQFASVVDVDLVSVDAAYSP